MSLPIYQRVAVTDTGDVIPGAEYTVINENTGVAAPIYSDRTGLTLLSPPYFADSVGTIQFFIAQGTTFRVSASGGVGTYTDRYVYGVSAAVLALADGSATINRVGSDGSVLRIQKDGATVGNIGVNSTTPYMSGNLGGFRLTSSGGAGVMLPTDVNGNNSDADNDLGAATARWRDLHLFGTAHVTGSISVGLPYPEAEIDVNGTIRARSRFLAQPGAGPNYGYQFVGDGNTGMYSDNADTLQFSTNGSEKLRINSIGVVMVGTSTQGGVNGWSLYPAGSGAAPLQVFNKALGSLTTAISFEVNTSQVGQISYSSTGVNYSSISDERLKENITDADDSGSLVDSIQVRKFNWKVDGSSQDYGVIAQELVKVAPVAVSVPENPEDMLGVDYAKLVPMLIKEVQSLRTRVAALESN